MKKKKTTEETDDIQGLFHVYCPYCKKRMRVAEYGVTSGGFPTMDGRHRSLEFIPLEIVEDFVCVCRKCNRKITIKSEGYRFHDKQ